MHPPLEAGEDVRLGEAQHIIRPTATSTVPDTDREPRDPTTAPDGYPEMPNANAVLDSDANFSCLNQFN